PTQLLNEGAQAGAAAQLGGTSPLGEGAHTEGVAGQRPTEYQPAAGQQTSALVGHPFGAQPLAVGAPPARKSRRGVWLFALLAVFVLGAGLASGAAFIWWRATHRGTVVKIVKTGPQGAPAVPAVPPVPEVPEIPADLGERINEALKGAGVGLPLDESGAVVSGDDTILTRTFKLDPGASFSAHVMTGNITVVGADADEAVVKIVKHGGSVQERASTRVLAAENEEGVMLLGTPPNGRVSVSFEVKVPRGLHQLNIAVNKGDVHVSEFAGAVHSKVIDGNTRVNFPSAEREGEQEFTVVKGDIEATLPDGADADLRAESLTGNIALDEDFGLRVERGPAGRRVSGHLGEGGDALLLKVINGDIKLKK
ncbi:MAG: DUF4097 family beta strand repeat-containing protein, partial [Pyrinomonadaceae bacterium]